MLRCLLIDPNNTSRRQVQLQLRLLGIAAGDCDITSADFVLLGNPMIDTMRVKVKGNLPVLAYFSQPPSTDIVGQLITRGVADVFVLPIGVQQLSFKLRQSGIALMARAA